MAKDSETAPPKAAVTTAAQGVNVQLAPAGQAAIARMARAKNKVAERLKAVSQCAWR
jgi:hypothetical protein